VNHAHASYVFSQCFFTKGHCQLLAWQQNTGLSRYRTGAVKTEQCHTLIPVSATAVVVDNPYTSQNRLCFF